MGVLGGFASAVVLGMVALLMAGESVHRMFAPLAIRFGEAIGIAVVGLLVNLVCALLLKGEHHHHHGHNHGDHAHGHHHGEDLNLRAACIQVLADALTSVTAIVALVAGKFFGWSWIDPVMGLVGSAVVAVWAWGLLRETSGILLDRTPATSDLLEEIRRAVEGGGDALVSDLHVWQIGAGKYSAIVAVVAPEPRAPEFHRAPFPRTRRAGPRDRGSAALRGTRRGLKRGSGGESGKVHGHRDLPGARRLLAFPRHEQTRHHP